MYERERHLSPKPASEPQSRDSKSRSLAIPIYLNQRIVFDLAAVIEDGFSEFRTIKTFESSEQVSEKGVSGSIGISNVFALLGIGLSGSLSGKNGSIQHQEEVAERVYTPASVFAKVRTYLAENGVLEQVSHDSDLSNIQSGAYVEFRGVLRKNPLIHSLESMISGFELADVFKDYPGKATSQPAGAGQPKKQGAQPLLKVLKDLIPKLRRPNTTDLVGAIPGTQIQAVVPVEHEYFTSHTPATIYDGDFVVLGKVVKVVGTDSDESINLLRETALGMFPAGTLDDLAEHLSGLADKGFQIPKVETRLSGPAIQVIPIAIFA